MKAIVLSYDVNQGFSELTYKMYKAWENCPLIFRIPGIKVDRVILREGQMLN